MDWTLKQPALRKHPKGTASYSIRVRLPDGGTWHACTEVAHPIEQLIAEIEEQLLFLRRMAALR